MVSKSIALSVSLFDIGKANESCLSLGGRCSKDGDKIVKCGSASCVT